MDTAGDAPELHLAGAMAAVIRVLKAFAKTLANSKVKWFTDNQNVVRIIQVESKVSNLQVLAIELFLLAILHQIMVEPEWVPRTNNELADYKVLQ